MLLRVRLVCLLRRHPRLLPLKGKRLAGMPHLEGLVQEVVPPAAALRVQRAKLFSQVLKIIRSDLRLRHLILPDRRPEIGLKLPIGQRFRTDPGDYLSHRLRIAEDLLLLLLDFLFIQFRGRR